MCVTKIWLFHANMIWYFAFHIIMLALRAKMIRADAPILFFLLPPPSRHIFKVMISFSRYYVLSRFMILYKIVRKIFSRESARRAYAGCRAERYTAGEDEICDIYVFFFAAAYFPSAFRHAAATVCGAAITLPHYYFYAFHILRHDAGGEKDIIYSFFAMPPPPLLLPASFSRERYYYAAAMMPRAITMPLIFIYMIW